MASKLFDALEKKISQRFGDDSWYVEKATVSGGEPVDMDRYPHKCPHCNGPAYIGGDNTVDCVDCDNGIMKPKITRSTIGGIKIIGEFLI
jgi:hypothetical protein